MDFSNLKELLVDGIKLVELKINGVLVWAAKAFTNQVPLSTTEDGKTIYNGGLGYKNKTRIRSGGAEATANYAACTGFIPVKAGDIVRLSGYNALIASSENAINVFDASHTNLGQVVGNAGNGYGIFQQAAYKAYNFSSIVENPTGVYSWTVPPHPDIRFMRVTGNTGVLAGDGSVMIVTVNEEIA
jgi:hypothetical protein